MNGDRSPEDLEHAKAVLGEHADRQVEISRDGALT